MTNQMVKGNTAVIIGAMYAGCDCFFGYPITPASEILHEASKYFPMVGRNDDIIKSSGYRIGPYEVESAVLSHEAVSNCAITAYPDEVRGQIVKATIILQPGFEPSEELTKDIQNHVKRVTAPYKYPRMIEYVDEIPETISGKIRRVEIRDKDKNQ